MGEGDSGTFFSIRPKVAIIMLIYVGLAYSCCFAFAQGTNYSNVDKGITVYSAGTIEVTTVNESAPPTEEEEAQNQGLDLALLIGSGGGLFSIWAITRSQGEKKELLKWAMLFNPIVTTGSYVAGYQLSKMGVNLGVGQMVNLIMTFINHIFNLIFMMLDFLTFGIVDSPYVPSIPYPFNLIPIFMVLPITIIIFVWLAGLIIEGLKALFKVPLAG